MIGWRIHVPRWTLADLMIAVAVVALVAFAALRLRAVGILFLAYTYGVFPFIVIPFWFARKKRSKMRRLDWLALAIGVLAVLGWGWFFAAEGRGLPARVVDWGIRILSGLTILLNLILTLTLGFHLLRAIRVRLLSASTGS